MAYKSIRLYNFRNLLDAEIQLGQEVYFLVGENGAGKSSFLEALYLLSYGSSFREKNLEHCLRNPYDPFSISGKIGQQHTLHEVQIQLAKREEKNKEKRKEKTKSPKKQIILDSKKLQDRKELLSLNPCIVFAHGDISYINGSPREKRQFIDQTISLIDPYYIDLSRNYAKNLAQRNWVLKNKQASLLPTYTLQMVEIGLEIQRRRREHCARLSAVFSDLFQRVSNFGLPLKIKYQPSWPDFEESASKAVEKCLEYLEQRRERDMLFGSSQSGPHRDQLQFIVEADSQERQEKDFTKVASTGQLRLAALALKNAQASYLQKLCETPSVLLFDDVLLEMDSQRRKLFLACLPAYQQVFFTFLPNEDFQGYPFSSYQVLQLEKGSIFPHA